MNPVHLKLQHSESVVIAAASRIYAAYVAAGRVSEGQEGVFLDKALSEAIHLAQRADSYIVSDSEMS